MPNWTHLIRFRAVEDGQVHLGQVVDTSRDVGLDCLSGVEVKAFLINGDIFNGTVTNHVLTVDHLLSPVSREQCNYIRCLGLNYRDHAAEGGFPIPSELEVFTKPRAALTGPYPAAIPIPKCAQDGTSDYEAELCIVIGKTGRDIPEDKALEYILGYTASNDVSARTLQLAAKQWSFSKGLDNSCPIGPVLVSPSVIDDPQSLGIKAIYNGQTVQDGNTKDMIFSIKKQISCLSRGTTLEAGSIVLTGTPAGIGYFRNPRVSLENGSRIDIHIEKIGTLNWSTLWKTLVIVNQGIFVITSVIPTLSIAPLTPIFMQQWQKSLTDVALLTGVTVILLGYCNFIIIPSCEIFGRRITLLVCAILNIGACIWQATATSYGSFLGARILAGTGASANESIMNVVVTDIYFLHERGKYVGSYFWCYFMGLFLGPIISGAVAEHVSFRIFFWACTGAQGLNIIALLFFFPETRRSREQSPIPGVTVSEEANVDNAKIETSSGHAEFVSSPQIQNFQPEIQGSGRPSRSQFGIFQPIDRSAWRSVVRHFFTPAYILFFPIIFWASMATGSAANALLAVNILQSPGLSAPPYNFTPAQVGYANFALVVGGVFGLAVAGPWSDYVSQRATIKNKGIREPEMRLISLSPFIVVVIIGLVVFSVGLQEKWPWPAVIIIGFGFVGIQVVAIPTIAITYAIDCYRPISGEIMAIATVCKNTFGFGMTYFVNDWATTDGFVPPVMLLMAMTAGFTLVGMVALIFYGKSCRRITRNSRVHSF
ncbi:hypothetical protein V8C40DRAFT_262911 [Trichoderma camerunense]